MPPQRPTIHRKPAAAGARCHSQYLPRRKIISRPRHSVKLPHPPGVSNFPRHSGASRNLRAAMDSVFPVIPIPPVIPAQAGIQGVWSYSRSFRLPSRHSGASRNPGRVVIFTVIPPPPSRHSGLRRNPGRVAIFTVIPDPSSRHTGSPQPSFRRKPESTRCDGLRFSPERRLHTQTTRKETQPTLSAAFPIRRFKFFASFQFCPVIPVSPSFQFSPSFRRKPESTPCDGLRFSPERQLHIPTNRKEPLPTLSRTAPVP